MDCSCPDWAVPCKHVAAVCYLLAEAFDEDPFAILAWRGREREDLLANLHAARGAGGPSPPASRAACRWPTASARSSRCRVRSAGQARPRPQAVPCWTNCPR